MTSRSDLDAALKDAMRAGDEVRKTTIRMVISAIKLSEVEKHTTLDDNAILQVLQKEVKSRRESVADAEKAGRADLVESSLAEIRVLESFLPKGFSVEEMDTLARQAVAEVGATTIKEMGAVMKVLMPRLQGRASGDQASLAVRKLLQ